MKIRERVAQNLQRLTYAVGSAAHVSRQMGINPMQYGRYLSGQQMPNDATMRKICAYFEVTELDLIEPPGESGDSDHPVVVFLQRPQVKQMIAANLGAPDEELVRGQYFVYFHISDYPDTVVRTAMEVQDEDGAVTFTRYSYLSGDSHPAFAHFDSQHYGLVTGFRGSHFFGGIDTRQSRTPSLLMANWFNNSNRLLAGVGLVQGPTGGVGARFAMNLLEEPMDVEELKGACRTFEMGSQDIPPQVRLALQTR